MPQITEGKKVANLETPKTHNRCIEKQESLINHFLHNKSSLKYVIYKSIRVKSINFAQICGLSPEKRNDQIVTNCLASFMARFLPINAC